MRNFRVLVCFGYSRLREWVFSRFSGRYSFWSLYVFFFWVRGWFRGINSGNKGKKMEIVRLKFFVVC